MPAPKKSPRPKARPPKLMPNKSPTDRGNKAAKRRAEEGSPKKTDKYAKGGMVCRGGGAANKGKRFTRCG